MTSNPRALVVPALCVAALLGSASMLATGGTAVAADETNAEGAVQWHTDIKVATAKAKASGKPLFLDFTADWCPPCKQMERDTWTDPQVQAMINEVFTPVKIDVDVDPDTARLHRVQSIPTLMVFRGDEPADRVVGYHGPDELMTWLKEHAPEASAEAEATSVAR